MAANEESAFSYAAALLHQEQDSSTGWMSSTGEVQRRAAEALAEVDRKLALVESLAERIGRERPEDVAGPLMRLHGYGVGGEEKKGEDSDSDDDGIDANIDEFDVVGGNVHGDAYSLVSMRDKADRLRRQGEVLEGVAKRVESSLQRGLGRMEGATSRLGRVLHLSATLKMVMRLMFEAKKVTGSGVDFDSLTSGAAAAAASSSGALSYSVDMDLRDLTRAAASVAVMEDLLSHPDLGGSGPDGSVAPSAESRIDTIDVVERLRPDAEAVASAVRRAAAGLLAEQQRTGTAGMSPHRLGATLQVYYHLGELPQAAWDAVSAGLASAEKASAGFFNPAAVQRLVDQAQSEAKAAVAQGGEDDPNARLPPGTDKRQKKKQTESAYERSLKKRLREKRAEAAGKWARGVADAALRVWTLQRVLARKSDPVSRRNFLEAVREAPVPEKFEQAEEILLKGGGGGERAKDPRHVKNFIFALFWNQMCLKLGQRIQKLLRYNDGAIAEDVAALYPAVRAAALDMLGSVHDSMQAGLGAASAAAAAASASGSAGAGGGVNAMADDGLGVSGAGTGAGILGGSAGLDDSAFFGGWIAPGSGNSRLSDAAAERGHDDSDDADAGAGGSVAADTWTRADDDEDETRAREAADTGAPVGVGAAALAAIFSSPEWSALQGSSSSQTGLHPLQSSFLEASSERLCAPLRYMFPEAVAVDENGAAIPVLPHLPSRYDLAKLDSAVRDELSLADPREGGGELSMTTMLAGNVVDMVGRFCAAAAGATSDAGEEGFLREDDGAATEALLHDMKVAGVMSTLATSLRSVPENTFVVPYRPAHSPQHEDAANLCRQSLKPALAEIDSLVKTNVLAPLSRALNRRVASAVAKMHQGTYLEENVGASMGMVGMDDPMSGEGGGVGGGFVQRHLSQVYESIASEHLSKLPPEYASAVASTVASHSIYSFVSHASLVRPLGEMGRLRITQDLADFELCLEQLVFKGGSTASLGSMDGGRPYAELRAMRNMLFWTGLEDTSAKPADIAKGMLREAWVRDVRPSTAFHFLFSFAPPLLSSPHHAKRMSAEEYVGTLVKLDGTVDDGEASAWMTTMRCCESYQQRESVDASSSVVGGKGGGDRRVAAVLMMLGPELLRRRRL